MPLILATVGAALLAYCVFLISGIGVAITAFAGIMLVVIAIYWWFLQTRNNAVLFHNVRREEHFELTQLLRNLK